MESIFYGVRAAAEECETEKSCAFIFPVHKSPVVQRIAKVTFGSNVNVFLVAPLDYQEMVSLYDKVDVIVTDSGGIQE
jgi:UDP-N-acetylglucosamine 2-epimerase (non-hydrolysing)